jgi:cell wall-associated NlpC family hydrolase
MSKKGIDCSGLVCLVFRDAGIPGLPHSTKALVHRGKVVSLAQVKPGDLLFFHTGFFRTIDHVGICIGDNRFIHASIQLGVIESSMDDNYYRSRFSQARRLF